jgi:membrane fusion protein, copper/silver efflux system
MTKSVLSMLFIAACAKNAPAPVSPVVDPVPMAEPTAKPAASPVTATLAAYEHARALLAADKLEGLADAAREIETGAKKGDGHHYSEIASSAAKLATATDIESARASFADVSKHLIALLAADPSLARGQHVFECPMVKGYNKWVQPTEDLQNPYMGKRMLACGGESTWN